MNVEIKLYLDGVEFEIGEEVSYKSKEYSIAFRGYISDFNKDSIKIFFCDDFREIKFENLEWLLKVTN
jgi:hypothetical protein